MDWNSILTGVIGLLVGGVGGSAVGYRIGININKGNTQKQRAGKNLKGGQTMIGGGVTRQDPPPPPPPATPPATPPTTPPTP